MCCGNPSKKHQGLFFGVESKRGVGVGRVGSQRKVYVKAKCSTAWPVFVSMYLYVCMHFLYFPHFTAMIRKSFWTSLRCCRSCLWANWSLHCTLYCHSRLNYSPLAQPCNDPVHQCYWKRSIPWEYSHSWPWYDGSDPKLGRTSLWTQFERQTLASWGKKKQGSLVP